MGKISVIVPVYNIGKYIGRCLESIINQTYDNLEILVIDDGSKDNSGEICDHYAQKDGRIKVIHKENGGVSSARNLGLKMATGDYISFVDGDDYIDNRMYEILLNNLVSTKSDISICDFMTTGVDDDKTIFINNIYELSNEDAIKHLYIDKDLTFVSLCSKVYKIEIFHNVIMPCISCAEDNYILYKLLYKSNKIVYTPSKLYKYYQRGNSAVHTFDESSANDFEAFDIQMEFWKSQNRMDLFRLCFERNFKRLIMTLDCSGSAQKCDNFNDILKNKYEKTVKKHIKNLKVGPIEKKLYLVDWTNEKNHYLSLLYIRLKMLWRNYKFLKNNNLY